VGKLSAARADRMARSPLAACASPSLEGSIPCAAVSTRSRCERSPPVSSQWLWPSSGVVWGCRQRERAVGKLSAARADRMARSPLAACASPSLEGSIPCAAVSTRSRCERRPPVSSQWLWPSSGVVWGCRQRERAVGKLSAARAQRTRTHTSPPPFPIPLQKHVSWPTLRDCAVDLLMCMTPRFDPSLRWL
jgi:hypothetical protein